MMKITLLAISLCMFFSCARQTLTKRLTDHKYDSFYQETYIRYTKNRLPSGPQGQFAQELHACYDQDFSQALGALKKKLEGNRKNPLYWNTYGICYYLKDDFPKADYFLQLAISYSQEKFLPAINNLAMSKYKQGQNMQALQILNDLSKRDPSLRVPRFNRAQMYLEYAHYDYALGLLHQLQNEYENDPDILVSLGATYLLKSNYPKALEYFSKIDQKRQDHPDMIFYRALMALEQEQWARAKEIISSKHFTKTLVLKRFAKKIYAIAHGKLVEIEKMKKEKDATKTLKTKKKV